MTVVEQHIIACVQMFSFGFDTCTKVNSPLVNRLISNTLLIAKPGFNQTQLQFISVQFLTDFWQTRYCSTPHIL